MWLNFVRIALIILLQGVNDHELVGVNVRLQKIPKKTNGAKLHDLGDQFGPSKREITRLGNDLSRDRIVSRTVWCVAPSR